MFGRVFLSTAMNNPPLFRVRIYPRCLGHSSITHLSFLDPIHRGIRAPPKHLVDSPGYYFDPPKCSINAPGYPDSPHPVSYYNNIGGFPEPLYASSLHPETEEGSSYKNNYCESSDRLLLLPTPKFYSYGNSYSHCGQSRLPQEYEDYPQSQFSKSASTKIDDYFQFFS